MVLAVPTNEKNVRTPLPPSDPPTSADIYAASDYLNRVRFRALSADDAQTRPTDEDIANAHEYLHCVVAKKAAEVMWPATLFEPVQQQMVAMQEQTQQQIQQQFTNMQQQMQQQIQQQIQQQFTNMQQQTQQQFVNMQQQLVNMQQQLVNMQQQIQPRLTNIEQQLGNIGRDQAIAYNSARGPGWPQPYKVVSFPDGTLPGDHNLPVLSTIEAIRDLTNIQTQNYYTLYEIEGPATTYADRRQAIAMHIGSNSNPLL